MLLLDSVRSHPRNLLRLIQGRWLKRFMVKPKKDLMYFKQYLSIELKEVNKLVPCTWL